MAQPSSNVPHMYRIISDLHVGSWWFRDPQSHALLNSFLDMQTDEARLNASGLKKADALMFLGDTVDYWLWEPSVVPPTPSEYWNMTLYGYSMPEFAERVRRIERSNITLVAVTRVSDAATAPPPNC